MVKSYKRRTRRGGTYKRKNRRGGTYKKKSRRGGGKNNGNGLRHRKKNSAAPNTVNMSRNNNRPVASNVLTWKKTKKCLGNSCRIAGKIANHAVGAAAGCALGAGAGCASALAMNQDIRNTFGNNATNPENTFKGMKAFTAAGAVAGGVAGACLGAKNCLKKTQNILKNGGGKKKTKRLRRKKRKSRKN